MVVSMNPSLLHRAIRSNLFSDMEDPSPFVIKVYQKHRIGQDKVVATLTDTTGGILGRLKDGGTKLKCLLECDADAVVAFKCLKRILARIPPMDPISRG